MRGPFLSGTHARFVQQVPNAVPKLRCGHSYRVKTAFVDADGDLHKQGETWRLIVSMHSIYYEELVLTVCFTPNDEEWHIPLSDRQACQQDVAKNPLNYFEEATLEDASL